MARVSRKKSSQTDSTIVEPVFVWNTALYVRLSVEDNGKESDSIENQIRILEEYIEDHPYLKKSGIYADNGYTGTNFDRPEYSHMMDDIRSGKINCIIVKDLSRFGRTYIETSEFIEKICPFYGLRFIAVNDSYDTATITSEGQLSASLSNIINDYYAKDISRKVRSALQAKMERGDYIGNYAPHGYLKDPNNKNRLLIDPVTAPVIRQIYEWRAEGISYMGINKRLNDAGVPSPGQYRFDNGIKTNNNKKTRTILWNKHIVTAILQDEVYIGNLAQRKGAQCLFGGIPYHLTERSEWVIVENTHEAIISKELFDIVQKINREACEKSKRNAGKYDYLPKEKNIYGRKFTCADCGAKMKLTRSFSTKKDKAYFTFKCPTYAEHGSAGCSDIKMRKSELDAAVFAFIKSQMNVFIDMESTLKKLLIIKKSSLKQSNTARELKALKQKLSHNQSMLSNLYIDLKEGLLSNEDYVHHKSVIMSDIKALETKTGEIEAEKNETEEQITGEMKWKLLIRRFYDANEISEDMVNAFIKSMKLHSDGTLDITLCYMDEFEKLMHTCEKIRKEVA